MPSVNFLISNAGHHAAMTAPVVRLLAQQPGYRIRVVSLCEFRGIVSPTERFQVDGVDFVKVLPRRFRESSWGGQGSGSSGGPTVKRRAARTASWHGLLRRPLARVLEQRPDLVVLPNDAAFPYDRLVTQLRAREIPFLLLQEGIRFALPASGEPVYGTGRAAAIAAWGEGSAEYFRAQGVPNESIHLTGSPRFDLIWETDWGAPATKIKTQHGLEDQTLLLLTNPIDDQGFCSTQEKMDLVGRFMAELAPLFEEPGFRLVIKLHGRENLGAYRELAASLPYNQHIVVLQNAPLYPLFTVSQAAIVLASTVGLEALLFDLPLGVLELPGTGFVYDYVGSGAALGLAWDAPLHGQVESLLKGETDGRAVQAYVQRSLAVRRESAEAVVGLIHSLTGGSP